MEIFTATESTLHWKQINLVVKNSGENIFLNICYSSQWQGSENTFTLNSSNQNNFFQEKRVVIKNSLYLWAK